LSGIPVVNFFLHAVFLVAIPFLNSAFELVALPGDDIEIVVGELAPTAL